MRKLALQVEHKFKNRVVGVHMIDGGKSTTTIGSSRTADIRVIGDDIAGLHAAFECAEGEWTLSDLGSTSGTWINKKPIIEQKIDGATVIHIGNHQLKATPHMIERELFNKPLEEGKSGVVYHQVVIFKKGHVQQTLLLEKTQAFNSIIPGLSKSFAAPTSFDWTESKEGQYIVKQRLAKADKLQERVVDTFGDDWKRPAPIMAALLMIAVVFGMVFMIPQKADDSMKTITPDNQYTRMIFDGRKVKQKRAIAEKLRKTMRTENQQAAAAPKNDAKTAQAKAPAKVVVNLKNAGLSALIGKVAARASKNALLVAAAGVSAENAKSGRALGLGGGSSLDKVGHTGGNESARVGGIGTAGKGGGKSGYAGTGTLSNGTTGSADVGVLEEETEVEGGLDKEAIARVIRSQLGQIRYCYERQLSANPDLYGKILVKFTIGGAGSVTAQTIGNTSLNNAMVEGCILRRIAGWQFPTPKGGANVQVTYPFLFKSTR